MSNLKFKARFLQLGYAALAGPPHRSDGVEDSPGILKLTPPPTSKGRWVLAKAALAMEPQVKLLSLETGRIGERYARKGADDKPLISERNGLRTFQIPAENIDAYKKELDALLDEEIELTGIRQITHAELGDCPATVEQVLALIQIGLLEDKEPE